MPVLLIVLGVAIIWLTLTGRMGKLTTALFGVAPKGA